VHLRNAFEVFMLQAKAFAAADYRDKVRLKTRDAMRDKAARGYVAGGIVYGYENRRAAAGHVERVIVSAEADVVRRIFALVASGMGFSRIAQTLNREGVPCPRQGRGWSQSGVYEIVRRRLYRGEQVYGQTKWIDHGGTKRKVRTSPEEWIVTSMPALRIVDEALWQAAHARLEATRQQYRFTKRGKLTGRPAGHAGGRYMLSGLVAHAECEGRCYVVRDPTRSGTVAAYYECSVRRYRGEVYCASGLRVPMEALDRAILNEIERHIFDETFLEDIIRGACDRARARERSGNAGRTALQRQLRAVSQGANNYIRAIGAGIDPADVREALARARHHQQALTDRLEGWDRSTPVLDRSALRNRLDDWRVLLRAAPEQAQRILRLLFPEPLRVTAFSGGWRYTGHAVFADLVAGLIPGRGGSVALLVPPGCHARTFRRDSFPR
jgi:site-specific DNA recombinase